MQPKASKRSILWIVPILLIAALFYYFKPASNQEQYIASAKDLVVPQSEQTFGESLHKHCEKTDWSFFETNRGQKVVEFSGECALTEKQPLNIQFLIDDENKVDVGAMLVNHKKVEDMNKADYFKQIATP